MPVRFRTQRRTDAQAMNEQDRLHLDRLENTRLRLNLQAPKPIRRGYRSASRRWNARSKQCWRALHASSNHGAHRTAARVGQKVGHPVCYSVHGGIGL
jgi:hypothetical protein